MTGYEVLSFHVASDPNRSVGKNFFFDSYPAPPNVPMPQDYLFWVIRGEGRCIVVDTCITVASAEARNRVMFRTVESHLRAVGVDPRTITDVIMTHLHWDHAGNLGLFPGARLHVQADEIAYCTGAAMLQHGINKIYAVEDVQSFLIPLFDGRVNLLDGDVELFPGISVAKVGGHTPGSQAVVVKTNRGSIVLASDAAHFWANIQRRSPFPILDSFTQALRAFDRLYALGDGRLDRILPGHDPLLRSVFPALPGHEGAICLHLEPLVDVSSTIEAQFSRVDVG